VHAQCRVGGSFKGMEAAGPSCASSVCAKCEHGGAAASARTASWTPTVSRDEADYDRERETAKVQPSALTSNTWIPSLSLYASLA
jgi:hypothetical protein